MACNKVGLSRNGEQIRSEQWSDRVYLPLIATLETER
jgi:hypothetical protein